MLPYGRCEIIIGSSEQQHPTLLSDFKCFALDISTGSSMDAPCRYGYPVGQVADLVLCCHPQEKSKATVMECILCILLARSLGTDYSITAVLRGKIITARAGGTNAFMAIPVRVFAHVHQQAFTLHVT